MITADPGTARHLQPVHSSRRPSPPMNPGSPQQLLCQILGISPADLLQANRLLRLPPDERIPAVIDQAPLWCFSRMQAAQSSVGPDVARWMMQTIAQARMAMLQAPPPVAQPPYAAVPASIPCQQPWYPQAAYPHATEEPAIVIKKRIPRRRNALAENFLSLLGVVVILGAGLFFGKLFIEQWWKNLPINGKSRAGSGAMKAPVVDSKPAPRIRRGGGRPSDDPATDQAAPPPAPATGDTAKARAFMKDALRAAQMGAFDEADLNAEKAIGAAPGYDEADAMRLVVAYQQ